MKVDFHVHTSFSPDGKISLNDLKRVSEKLGVIPTISDHDTISAFSKAKSIGLRFIPGIEVSSLDGHIIGLFVNEPIKPGLTGQETIDIIKSQGALSYIAHPFDYWRMGCVNLNVIQKADIIEAYNQKSPDYLNSLNERMAVSTKKAYAAGSDSHYIQEFGKTYTIIDCDFDDLTPKKLIRCLRKPKLVKGKQPLLLSLARNINRIFNIKTLKRNT